jgi:branched-chain amino acid transport system permease protein
MVRLIGCAWLKGVTHVKPALILAGLLLWLAAPFVPGVPLFWVTLANYAGIGAIVATGLVVLTGVGGMTSFAQATFMGFGAYATALLTTRLGWSPWLALPVSLAVSALAALLIGAITLRLSGHYLALGTIAWAVSFYYIFGNSDLVNRNDGISGIPPVAIAGHKLLSGREYFVVVWLAAALALLLTRNLLDSRVGRSLRALRGGAAAAASFGVHLPWVRLLAFTWAATLAGFAGWLYVHMQRSVNPTPFGLNAGIEYLLMAVLGGVAYLPGAVLGAALFVAINDQLQDLLPRLLGGLGGFETVVFGALLVLILQAAPDGLWPHLRAFWRRLLPRGRPAAATVAAVAPSLPVRARPAPGTPLLDASDLRKQFGGLVAVNGVSLHVDAAEIVGLIGPNGAGKSTIFNLLTGVAKPTGGAIRFEGRDVGGLAPPQVAALGVARSFQHVKLVPGMSAVENAALGAYLRGRKGALAAMLRLDRAEEARLLAEARRQLARVGLAAHAGRPADSLPLGQQRTLEIARALCLDPVLLLLDEPAAGLRLHEKRELAALLRRLREEGVAILLIEHDMDFVMRLADRLVVMASGQRLAEGPADVIRRDPRVIEAYLGAAA